MAEPTPFKIAVSNELLSFIDQRIATARIPPGIELPEKDAWSFGVPPEIISQLRDYWENKYDWRAVEARLNGQLKMFTLPISEAGETMTIHFVHHKSDHEGAIPLLFQHGWPGNFLEVEKIIDSLTNPKDPSQQAFHVIAPSLPGFAFSEGPKGGDFWLKNIAAVDHKLMLALGYDKYVVQGGDWGSMIARIMGIDYPEHCVAVHVNALASGPPSWWRYPFHLAYLIIWAMWQRKGKDSNFGRMMWWREEEMGYLEIQGTKPLAVSYGLVDSPIGMLAWLRDKLQPLADGDYIWKEEELITWAMLYIINGTAGHAQIYKNAKAKGLEHFYTDLLNKTVPKNVDFGASTFPKDVLNIPRWWASCTVASNIVFWRDHDKGGHFPATEIPDVLVTDIRDFAKVINPTRMAGLIKSGKLKK